MKKTLAQNALFNVIYNLLNVVFPLISATYVSRVLSPEGVGEVAYAQNIASYFLMFAVLGIPSYGMRAIARCKDDKLKTDSVFSELIAINSCSTLICLVAYFLVVHFLFTGERLIYYIFGLEVAFNFINIDWLYRGKEDYGYIAARSTLVKILSLVALFIFVKDRGDCVIYAFILCMGVGFNYIFNAINARKYVKLRFSNLHLKQHLAPTVTLMLSTVTASLYSKVDITMLGIISSEAAVGYYTNAHKVTNIVLTLATAISAVFLPRLSYMYVNDRERFNDQVSLGVKIVLILVLPCCVGLISVADSLVDVMFGSLFAPAAATLQILAVLTIIKGVGDILCYQVIVSTGNEKKLVVSHLAAGIANIVMNAVLIPKFGHNGAAFASVISELIVNGILLVYSLKIIKLNIKPQFILSVVAPTLVMGVVVFLIRGLFSSSLLSLIVSVLVGVLIYFSLVLLLKNETALYVLKTAKEKFIKRKA